MMKTLVVASASMLVAHLAVASDFYGGFANPELETTVNTDFYTGAALATPSHVRPSIADFYQGDPDAPQYAYRGAQGGGGNTMGIVQEQPTSYEALVQGDPGIDTGSGFLVSSSLPHPYGRGMASAMPRPHGGS